MGGINQGIWQKMKKVITLPVKPRFSLDALREISIASGEGESTLANYVFIHKGRKVEKYARLEDLSRAEQAAALAFILLHGETRVKRKTPIRERPPIDLEALSLDDLPDLDAGTSPEMLPDLGAGTSPEDHEETPGAAALDADARRSPDPDAG